jgi:GT2 family glycosyltransferase/glycosyltransferase involved in cell wall biosynthesis
MAESRVCFVVTELLGLVRNGGIATATTHAALVLSQHGYDVDLFYCGHEEQMEEHWAARYRDAGVDVHRLDRTQLAHPPFAADSYRLYQQLKTQHHDVIVFQDWQGLGYFSTVAKREGLAFGATRLIHICHGPDAWLREANRQLALDGHELGQAHMEQRSAEFADVIVGPSRHLIDWMLGHGWQLPPERHVIPYFTEGHVADLDRTVGSDDVAGAPLTELVFFGRLEERKGVRVFAEALNLIGPDKLNGLSIAFLGREATVRRDDIVAMLDPTVRARIRTLHFHGAFDQAQARDYLRQPGRVALIPSYLDNSPNVVYECIEDRIPFLASRAGGTGELVAEADRARALFDPTPASLAAALAPVVEGGRTPAPPRPSYGGRTSLDAWRPLLSPRAAAPSLALHEDAPLVSVVVPHFNQPQLVWATLHSIAEQDYPNLEIVVVDDGSTDPAAVDNLRALEAHAWSRPLRVVRQENQYLGAARNTGAREARADLIAYVDDDDIIEQGYIQAAVRALLSTDADAVSMAIHGVEAAEDGTFPEEPADAVWAFFGDGVHLATMLNVVGGAAALYRREPFEKLGGFFLHRDIGHEDWDLLARFNLNGYRVVSVPEPLYTYRVRPKSMLRTTPTWANMQPVFASYREHLPDALKSWAELTRGQQDTIDDLRARVGASDAERIALAEALDHHRRYLAVLRRALPGRGRVPPA